MFTYSFLCFTYHFCFSHSLYGFTVLCIFYCFVYLLMYIFSIFVPFTFFSSFLLYLYCDVSMYEHIYTLHFFEYKFSFHLSFAVLSLNYSITYPVLFEFNKFISLESLFFLVSQSSFILYFLSTIPLCFSLSLLFFSIIIWIFTGSHYLLLKKSCMIYGIPSRNFCTHYGSLRDKRERKRRSIFKEKMAENFPNLRSKKGQRN